MTRYSGVYDLDLGMPICVQDAFYFVRPILILGHPDIEYVRTPVKYNPRFSRWLVQFEIVTAIALLIDVIEDASVWTLSAVGKNVLLGEDMSREQRRNVLNASVFEYLWGHVTELRSPPDVPLRDRKRQEPNNQHEGQSKESPLLQTQARGLARCAGLFSQA